MQTSVFDIRKQLRIICPAKQSSSWYPKLKSTPSWS